jgi:hypothetical protein
MRTPPRLEGLDAARGVAVVSMLVAHLSPVGGLLQLSEHLTAPLFAVVIGLSMGVQLRDRGPTPGWFVLQNLERGLLLLVLGVLLQVLYSPIVIVLPALGLLIIVLAPVALVLHRAPVLTLGVAVAGAVLGPIVRDRVRASWGGDEAVDGAGWAGAVLDWLVLGDVHRTASFLPMALGGLAFTAVLRRATQPPEGYAVAGVLVAGAAAAYLLGRGAAEGAAPYSGSTAEVVGGTLLATGVVVASFLLLRAARRVGAGRWLDPVLATGRLALTAYTVQIVVLAVLGVLRGGADDDSWLVLASTTAVVLGSCWALDRGWGTGPLEWVVHRLRPAQPHVGRHVRTPAG